MGDKSAGRIGTVTVALRGVGCRYLVAGSPLGRPSRRGFVATALLLANYNVLLHAQTGYPTMLFAVVLTVLLAVLNWGSTSWSVAMLAGGIIGLGYLVRPNMLAIAIPVLLLRSVERPGGARFASLSAVTALLVVSPYLAMNVNATGSLLGSSQGYIVLIDTPLYEQSSIYGYVAPPAPMAYFRQNPGALVDKIVLNLTVTPKNSLDGLSGPGAVLRCVWFGGSALDGNLTKTWPGSRLLLCSGRSPVTR